MANARWRKVREFVAFSGVGKQQTGLGVFLLDADLDTRDKCEVEETDDVDRLNEFNCDNVDLVSQDITRRSKAFRFTYTRLTAHIIARWLAYFYGIAAAPTGTPQNEVKTLTRSGTVSSGTFFVSFTLEGRSGSSNPISFSATAAQIQAALTDPTTTLGKIIKNGDIVVTGDWTSGIVCTFGGRLAHANLPIFTIDNTAISGGGSVVSAETTNGANKYHAITRSADQSKPLFSFAMGDKLLSVAARKFGDAVVGSINFTMSQEQQNVGMVVTVLASFNPSENISFPVPPCVNPTPLKTADCRILYNTTYETRDVVNHTIDLNDQVPVAALFAYDDIDVSNEGQRGDQPTQEITSEIYGNSSSGIDTLAKNESVVMHTTHFGNPGDRCSLIAPETKIKHQNNPYGFAGPLNESTVKINGTPFGITGDPIHVDAYLDETATFLGS